MQNEKEQIIESISKKISIEKEHILKNVLPKLAPGEKLSEYRKKEIVSEVYMDLALSFYVPIKLDDPSDPLVSLQVTKQILKISGITVEELKENAITNLEKKHLIKPMAEMLKDLGYGEAVSGPLEMLVISSENKNQGAALLLCANVLREVYCKLGSFIVLPSSIHELICIPNDETVEIGYLTDMVKQINEDIVEPHERLSNNIYIYENGGLSCIVASCPPKTDSSGLIFNDF
ncbi:MAG: DUF5688 family protein [Lachnospiraceae bacterium]|nr:DUF5688 family protein [Lachnospiraceae bacterium]